LAGNFADRFSMFAGGEETPALLTGGWGEVEVV
jgi:hypothetical protein